MNREDSVPPAGASLNRLALWPFRLAVLSLLVFGVVMIVIQVARAELADRSLRAGVAPLKELAHVQRHASRSLLLARHADPRIQGSCLQADPPAQCEVVQLLRNIEAASARLLNQRGGATGLPRSARLPDAMADDVRWLAQASASAREALGSSAQALPEQWLDLQERLQGIVNRASGLEQALLRQMQADQRTTRWLDAAAIVTVGLLMGLSVYLLFWLWGRVVEAFAQLRSSQARLKAYASAVPDIAYVIDEDGRVIERLGNDPDEFPPPIPVGERVTEHRPVEIAQAYLSTIQRALDSGQIESMETMLQDPSGGQRWFESRVARIDTPLPQVVDSRPNRQVIWLSREVTRRHLAELALRETNEGLEARVAERTQALNLAVEELRRFNYTVSHDLRAPLRAVEAYLALAMEEAGSSLSPDARELLERARKSARELSSMVESLRNLSRIGDLPIQATRVDLSAMAGELCEAFEIDRGLDRLTCQVEAGMSAWADEHLIRSLMQNLISNAVKYSAGRQPARIEVGTVQEPEGTVFFVRDNGAGFDMARAGQLFQPFSRLHSPQAFPGDGIGLATVRRIVQRHGGRIWAEGCPDAGACFYFTLPGVPPEREAQAPHPQTALDPQLSNGRSDGPR